MTYENVELPASNMTGDRDNGNFYCFNNGVMLAKQRNDPYSLVGSYPTDSHIGDVECVQYDGVHYWTLENQTSGVTLQKWFLSSGILRNRGIFSYATSFGTQYDADSFCLDSYNSDLSISANVGSVSIVVSDGDIFNVGDTIFLGPSSMPSFSGQYEEASVSSKSGNILYLSNSLGKSFLSGDSVYTTRYFYLFNKYSPYDNTKGSLLKFSADTGSLYSYSSSHLFGEVKASCFYDGRITFVKGHEVIQVNTATLNVYKHFAIDNLKIDRANISEIYAMWVYSDVMYFLKNEYVYYDSEWLSEGWGDYYNYTTTPFHTLLTSQIYFVEVQAEPDIIHALAPGVSEAKSNITITVLDQARQPLDGRTVNVSSSVGSVSPNVGTTVSGGVFTCVYDGTAVETEVDITAVVT